MEATVLPDRRRVLVGVAGEVRGPVFVDVMTGLPGRARHVPRDDAVFGLMRCGDDVTHDDLSALARWRGHRFGNVDRGGAATGLVSGDIAFRFLPPVTTLRFGRWRFGWLRDIAAAEAEPRRAATPCIPEQPGFDAAP